MPDSEKEVEWSQATSSAVLNLPTNSLQLLFGLTGGYEIEASPPRFLGGLEHFGCQPHSNALLGPDFYPGDVNVPPFVSAQ